MIADNPAIGRKPVIVVAIVGAVLQIVWTFVVTWFSGIFPLRLVWLGSLFGFVGGTNVINAILYTMLIDVTEPTERYSIPIDPLNLNSSSNQLTNPGLQGFNLLFVATCWFMDSDPYWAPDNLPIDDRSWQLDASVYRLGPLWSRNHGNHGFSRDYTFP